MEWIGDWIGSDPAVHLERHHEFHPEPRTNPIRAAPPGAFNLAVSKFHPTTNAFTPNRIASPQVSRESGARAARSRIRHRPAALDQVAFKLLRCSPPTPSRTRQGTRGKDLSLSHHPATSSGSSRCRGASGNARIDAMGHGWPLAGRGIDVESSHTTRPAMASPARTCFAAGGLRRHAPLPRVHAHPCDRGIGKMARPGASCRMRMSMGHLSSPDHKLYRTVPRTRRHGVPGAWLRHIFPEPDTARCAIERSRTSSHGGRARRPYEQRHHCTR